MQQVLIKLCKQKVNDFGYQASSTQASPMEAVTPNGPLFTFESSCPQLLLPSHQPLDIPISRSPPIQIPTIDGSFSTFVLNLSALETSC